MSKKFYIGSAVSMLGMAVLVPLILQEPIPAISSESQGVPEVSGRLDSTPRPEVFPDVSRDVPQETPPAEASSAESDATPPLPPAEAMTMSVGSKHPASRQGDGVHEEKTVSDAERPAQPSGSGKAPAGKSSGGDGNAAAQNESAPAGASSVTPAADAQETGRVKRGADAPGRQSPKVRPGTLVTRSTLPAQSGKQVITNAVLTMDGDVVTLRMEANGPISGRSFMLPSPDRVVLDIAGDWKLAVPRVPSNRMLRELRLGARGDGIRLVFDMRVKPNKATLKQAGSRVLELRIR